jgi:hypothetical protein
MISRRIRAHRLLHAATFAAGVVATTAIVAAQAGPSHAVTVFMTSPAARTAYLASAVIWEPREVPSPEQIVEGPPGRSALSRARANPPEGLPCTYESGGAAMGGKTTKFTCRLADGTSVRVKYFSGDPLSGNREIFAEVVATRLFWALGFDADAVYPITVRCLGCPQDPMTGKGPTSDRTLLGVVEPRYEGAVLLSRLDPDQGWIFAALDESIGRLSPESLRRTQRAHFDALTLLAVLVQHGDRKPPQQRLVCRDIDAAGGEVHSLNREDDDQFGIPAFFERPGAAACRRAVVTVQDLGATFGGAGQVSRRVTSKMHLPSWAAKPVFAPRVADPANPTAPRYCRGEITVAGTTGPNRRDNPRVSEAGRTLLAGQLARLSDAHIRALFDAGRVDALGERPQWTDPTSGQQYAGIDAWVAVFKDKRRQIETTTCPD